MAHEYANHPERFLLAKGCKQDDYINLLCDIIRHLSPTIAIERLISSAPRHLLLTSPLAGIKADEVRSRIIARLTTLGAHQGDLITTQL